MWDHNRDLLTQRASTILDDPDAAQYVYGVGFHWYENWSGGDPMFENVDKVQEMYPDKSFFSLKVVWKDLIRPIISFGPMVKDMENRSLMTLTMVL